VQTTPSTSFIDDWTRFVKKKIVNFSKRNSFTLNSLFSKEIIKFRRGLF
jgi:hypothetical protein